MSVSSEVNRIQAARDAIRAALSGAGVGRYIAGLEPEPLAELLAP